MEYIRNSTEHRSTSSNVVSVIDYNWFHFVLFLRDVALTLSVESVSQLRVWPRLCQWCQRIDILLQ